jgi:RNA polymerase sigma factor (sigma-70 family)
MLLNDYFTTRDPAILDTLYNTYHKRLRQYFKKRRLVGGDIDDCVQEVFFRLMQYEGRQAENEEAFVMMLARTVKNQWLIDAKFDGRRPVKGNQLQQETDEFFELESPAPSPLDAMILQETHDIIESTFDALPDDTKPLVEAFLRDDQSVAEITRGSSMTRIMVQRRLDNGIETIHRTMRRETPGFYAATAV